MILWLWLLCSVGFAGEVLLSSPVNELKVGQTIEIEVRYIDISSQERPRLPSQEGLSVQFKKMSTAAMKDNGSYKTVVTFSYAVSAQEEGVWKIGPAEVPNRGARSKIVSITVEPQRPGVVPALQLESSTSKEYYYEGEPFTYNLRFISHLRLYDLNWSVPSLDSFGTLNGLEEQQRKYTVLEEDKTMDVIDIEIPLMAKSTGFYEIAPASIGAQVVVSSVEEEERYGLISGIQQQMVSAKRVLLEVKDLPPPPEGFSGLVGQFELRVELQESKIALGDSASIKILIEGVGWIQNIDIPEADNQHFLSYDDQPSILRSLENGKVHSQFVLHRALVPQEEGLWDLTPTSIIVFDTEEEEYITLVSSSTQLLVEAGEASVDVRRFEDRADLDKGIGQQDIQAAPKDVYIASNSRKITWYVWGVAALLSGLCLRKYSPINKALPAITPTAVPRGKKAKYRYYLDRLDQHLAKHKGLRHLTKEDYRAYPEYFKIREELMAIVYGGVHPGDIEQRIQKLLRKKM